MFGENLAALFLLYVRPVAAISRILDRGKLWFAILVALAVSGLVHTPSMFVPLDPVHRASRTKAATAEQMAKDTPPTPPVASPTQSADSGDDEELAGTASAPGLFLGALFQWTGMMPGSFFAPLGALAVAFIPVIVCVRAAMGFGSFSIIMRRDYLALLMLMLFIWAGCYLPVTAAGFLIGFTPVMMIFYGAGAVYFALMAAMGLRTMLGIDFAPALGLAIVGCVGAVLGLAIFEVAGPLRSYALSPFLLYYAYIMFASDMRSLGDGLRSRQHMRQQLEISTNNPRDADAHYQLGLIYQNRRQFTEAISRFKRSIEIDPKEADPQYQMGRIARQQKRIDEAIGYLATAVALDDKLSQSEVWRELGAAYFDAGKTDEAAVALAKFVDRRPYDPEGLYYYGRALAKLGRGNEARESFQTAIESVKTMPPHRRAEVRQWGRAAKSELGEIG
jgi:tetratricopeptide (TPR) repeat protein